MAMKPDESAESLNPLPLDSTSEREEKDAVCPSGDEQQARNNAECKHSENEWRESEERLKFVLEGSALGFWDWNIETGEIKRNERWASMLGYTLQEVELTVKQWTDLIHPDDRAAAWQSVQDHLACLTPLHEAQYRMRAKDGEYRWIMDRGRVVKRDAQGRPLRMSGTHTDITESKQMEEKFLRIQRMESLGALAGGVAHDLNNILTPIMMAASMLHEEVPRAMREELVESIERAAERGASIVSQVLTFARGAKGERKVLKPAVLLAQMGRIVEETFPKSIALAVRLPEDLWNVVGDSTQLHQVLMNLCVNARDAMDDGGTLELGAENCDLDITSVDADAKPGRYVKLKIADSGMGMPPEILQKIFDPFFTTKGPAIGTGLGLSTAVGILRSHGGFIKVDSAVGKGTLFEVYLPATLAPIPEPEPIQEFAPTFSTGGTLLVVDDEMEILKVMQTVLEQGGYEVLTAGDGVSALERYEKHSGRIDLVITDMLMPHMDGIRLIETIRKHNPAVPIVVASGYGEEEREKELATLGVDAFLKKPFNINQLLVMVNRMLCRTAPH